MVYLCRKPPICAATSMFQLRALDSDAKPYWLVEKRYIFGADDEAHFRAFTGSTDDAQAALEVGEDSVMLYKLRGTSAVLINDQAVIRSAALKAGDEFRIGKARFRLEDPKLQRSHNFAAGARAPALWSLKARNSALASKIFELRDTMTLGRAQDCDIRLNVVHLSRHHAKLTVRKDGVYVDDLGSSNGTFVNGNRVQAATLRAGDEVAFDTLRFVVQGPETDLASTHIRKDLDSATTVRPALTDQQIAEFRRDAPGQRTEANLSDPIDSPTPTQTHAIAREEPRSKLIPVLALLALSATGVAACFLAI